MTSIDLDPSEWSEEPAQIDCAYGTYRLFIYRFHDESRDTQRYLMEAFPSFEEMFAYFENYPGIQKSILKEWL